MSPALLGVKAPSGTGWKRRNSKAYSGGWVVFLKQRKLDMLSLRNGTGMKELPALWVGGGMGHPVLNEAAVPMTVSV